MAGGNDASRYSRIKYFLSFLETFYLLLILFLSARCGLSARLADLVLETLPWPPAATAAYALAAYLFCYLLVFPLVFYRSFLLEHRFSLSNQGFGGWAADQVKSGILAFILSLFLLYFFYWSLRAFPGAWWVALSLFWSAANLFLARIAPVVILPMFFRYRPLQDEVLGARIAELAEKMGIGLTGVFEIDMSAKTVKANAGLVGWGSSRRVVLGDTLRRGYTVDEISVILAHEFSHQKLRHLPKLLALNSLAAAGCFYLIYATAPAALAWFSLGGPGDLAGLPLVAAYFVLFGLFTQPLSNFLSRRMERNADIMALRASGLFDAFISTMEKLAGQNLADRDPHPAIKFFFFDHPSIKERIEAAVRLRSAESV